MPNLSADQHCPAQPRPPNAGFQPLGVSSQRGLTLASLEAGSGTPAAEGDIRRDMYKDVPEGSDAVVDNVYLVAHGISPEGPPEPGELSFNPPALGLQAPSLALSAPATAINDQAA